MAFCDYHACDNCGERKTFYDADMSGIGWSAEQGAYLYGSNGDYEPGYRIYALCHECEKTHQVVIQPKEHAIQGTTVMSENHRQYSTPIPEFRQWLTCPTT